MRDLPQGIVIERNLLRDTLEVAGVRALRAGSARLRQNGFRASLKKGNRPVPGPKPGRFTAKGQIADAEVATTYGDPAPDKLRTRTHERRPETLEKR
jgi:hypothetical protein